ncbi:DUF3857 domain-containing protein [Mucilaginibacter terrenus]|uniref:DUF3857 domain-containing protein n=1 Tax=Mucilaginibacter terrenus TaxID=2482727 RepID=A0A3E2NQ82_9SPHI|nr:DUF3857 domain-containing protein [Mucilaginibacter terrenus]RFZ83147.1 DUF3857 domain-containing protein [Mucilaginibacter terrenus]
MNRLFAVLLACLLSFVAKAQTPVVPQVQPFGKISNADLEMKSCDFEPDANALVLFNQGEAYYDHNVDLSMTIHKRIKIFNDHGKNEANIRIEYVSGGHREYITGLQAQTINLVDGKPEIIKLDKKQVFTEIVDKNRSALVFSMPNVKAGSVIEYKYVWNSNDISDFPDWYFQESIPTRYSEFVTMIPDFMEFKIKANITKSLVKMDRSSEARSTGTGSSAISYSLEKETRAMAMVHSLPDEPYMSAKADNLESIVHQLTAVRPFGTFTKSFSDTWNKVAGYLVDDEDFGAQFKRKLTGEEAIIAKAKSMATDEQRMAYIFSEVKNAMKWNGVDRWYTNDGTVKAWEKKTGNSTEINLILYHLLKQAGLKVYPMIVSTRDHGKVVPYYTFLYQFNRTVVYVEAPDDKTFVLDATNKYNAYHETPSNILNGMGLWVDKEKKTFDKIYLAHTAPVRNVIMLNAAIKPGGKMSGTAQINSFSYNRTSALDHYKTDGEKKYIEYLTDKNNSLKISALKIENMEADTLPLVQNVDFDMDLTGSDENYIYFVPNLFSTLRTNPFLAENRFTDVEFGYRNNYMLNSTFSIPANYKVEALPKSVSMMMPDSSIVFRRFIANDADKVVVRYTIDYKKDTYSKGTYPEFFEFCKKMYEMLNEQVVLKKS